MSLQVQLYSRAAKEVIGENAETGYVHTLKNNKRVEVPVDETAVKNAIGAIEWAVKGILQEDFPMRACSSNCKNCDYRALCRQDVRELFLIIEVLQLAAAALFAVRTARFVLCAFHFYMSFRSLNRF